MKALDFQDEYPLLLKPGVKLVDAAREMIEYRKAHALVVDHGRPVGILSIRDVARALFVDVSEGVELLEYPDLRTALDTPISEYMTRDVVSAQLDISVYDAAKMMIKAGIGCLPLVDERGFFVALVTERGLCRAVARGLGASEEPVEAYATRRVEVIEADAWIMEAAGLMLQKGFRRLPVVAGDGSVVGLTTLYDVVEPVVSEESLEELRRGSTKPLEKPVTKAMEPPVLCKPRDTARTAAELVLASKSGAALLVDDGRLVGIVTERDLLKALARAAP